MFLDYTTEIRTFFDTNDVKAISAFRKFKEKHNVLILPYTLSHYEIESVDLRQKIIDEIILDVESRKNNGPVFVCVQKVNEDKKNISIIYKILFTDIKAAIYSYFDELMYNLNNYDQFIRQQLIYYFESLFSKIPTDVTFKQKFISDLALYNVSHDFRIGSSIHKKGLLRSHHGFMVEVNIHPTIEHKAFIKKAINLKTDGDIIYRGYIMFKDDFSVHDIDLSLYSLNDLYRAHFSIKRGYGSFAISCKEKSIPYMHNQNLETFYKEFSFENYKESLYKLLKFHNSKNTIYKELLPELYIPSAYDFRTLSFDEWDSRLLIQDMIDI